VGQSIQMFLTDRIREQARSHKGKGVALKIGGDVGCYAGLTVLH
jgi:hypothetical protein